MILIAHIFQHVNKLCLNQRDDNLAHSLSSVAAAVSCLPLSGRPTARASPPLPTDTAKRDQPAARCPLFPIPCRASRGPAAGPPRRSRKVVSISGPAATWEQPLTSAVGSGCARNARRPASPWDKVRELADYVVYSARSVCNTVHAPAGWRLGGVGVVRGVRGEGGQYAATDPMRRWVPRCP